MGSLMQRRRDIIANQEEFLPAGYQKVDYIVISGWACLKTNYIPTDGDEFEVVYMPTVITGITKSLFWAGTGTYQLGLVGYNYQDGDNTYQLYYYRHFSTGSAKELRPRVSLNNWYKATISASGLFSVNGYSINYPYEHELDGDSTTLWIFRRRNGESAYEGKLKTFIIKNNNVVKMNLIPCIQLSSNTAGMYDTVSKTFLYNTSAGSIIPSTLDT